MKNEAPNEIFCECGYVGAPELKKHLSTSELLFGIVLLLLLFPAGVIYLLVKYTSSKTPYCPKCGRNMYGDDQSVGEAGKDLGSKIMNAAKDPNVRSAVISGAKGIKKSASDLHNSMDL